MSSLVGAGIIERGIFDPTHVNEAAVYAAWACIVAAFYWTIARKHRPGVNGWLLLMLGLIMPLYALRYVFFGTRWGSNSSFAMVNMLFTPLCPARILLPCPDSNPANCHLTYPKMFQQSVDLPNSSAPSRISQPAEKAKSRVQLSIAETNLAYNAAGPSVLNKSQIWQHVPGIPFAHQSGVSISADAALNVSDSRGPAQHITQDRANLHFPVLVPLWRIYVKERPLPIYLHTTFMTVAALLWPLQLWKEFRRQNYVWHRRLGYVALAASALGSLSAAPYAVTYLLSAKIPETITGLGYLAMYSSAAYFLATGVQAARCKQIQQHQLNMIRLVGLSWGVSPLGRLLTILPPIIWFTGPWNNAAVVCLSWPLGICIAQTWLLSTHEQRDNNKAPGASSLGTEVPMH
ncbi:hypothetical protein WJX79_004067 [Trebouxia sp. C0005]